MEMVNFKTWLENTQFPPPDFPSDGSLGRWAWPHERSEEYGGNDPRFNLVVTSGEADKDKTNLELQIQGVLDNWIQYETPIPIDIAEKIYQLAKNRMYPPFFKIPEGALYRGTNGNVENGIFTPKYAVHSWTKDINVANHFARTRGGKVIVSNAFGGKFFDLTPLIQHNILSGHQYGKNEGEVVAIGPIRINI